MPIVYDREHQFVDTLLWDCEALVLPFSSDGRVIDTLMSGLIWSQPSHKPATSVA